VAESASEDTNTTQNILNTTQWLTVISIGISLIGLYYKHEEIKSAVFSRAPQPHEDALVPAQEEPLQRKGFRSMD